MRAIVLTTFILASLPVILFRPYVGVIVWTWIGLMNPHKLAWSFATDFPFAKLVGGATLVGAIISAQRKQWPLARETAGLLLFVLWMLFTTIFALEKEIAWAQWIKVAKIQTLVVLTMVLVTDRRKLSLFMWMIVISIGFYGVKGGLFTILSGGNSHVLGPQESFIADNNHLGLALVMVIPLMRYLQLSTPNRITRAGLSAGMILTGVGVLGTQSRGAFLGLLAMLAFLIFKSRKRALLFAVGAVALPLAVFLMPASWSSRMESIRSYRADASAMGRINAWRFAMRVATARPVFGGGYGVFTDRWFAVYAPNPTDVHDAHSIFFEVLGEHGSIGLVLFLGLGLLTWRSCTSLIHESRDDPDTLWASDLARLCQVSMVAYAVAGAFVGLAYFDLYYNVVAIVVVAKLIRQEDRLMGQDDREDAAFTWRETASASTR
jgi:probable O-glycosylation ligase (exosortase A-associated)